MESRLCNAVHHTLQVLLCHSLLPSSFLPIPSLSCLYSSDFRLSPSLDPHRRGYRMFFEGGFLLFLDTDYVAQVPLHLGIAMWLSLSNGIYIKRMYFMAHKNLPWMDNSLSLTPPAGSVLRFRDDCWWYWSFHQINSALCGAALILTLIHISTPCHQDHL